MFSPNDIRKLALAFDGVSEVDHWGRPAFRTTRRIFAVIRPADSGCICRRSGKNFSLRPIRKRS
jgi:hypothetical protein